MLESYQACLPDVLKTLVDGGYSGEDFAKEVRRILSATTEVVKRNEVHTFVVLRNGGSWSGHSAGSRTAGGYGKTARDSLNQASQ